jgi:hypothetical protein
MSRLNSSTALTPPANTLSILSIVIRAITEHRFRCDGDATTTLPAGAGRPR